MVFWRSWRPSKALLEGLGGGWEGPRASWAGLEGSELRLGSILEAFWSALESFWRLLEANLGVLGGFESHLRPPKTGPGCVFRGFGSVSAWFFRVFSNAEAKVES